MIFSKFYHSNLKVSKIGLGCVTFGREINKKDSFKIIDYSIDNGINLLNTSHYYSEGSSEKIIGEYFLSNGKRNKIILVSKIHGDMSKNKIINCVEKSLQRMKTNYVDYYGITYDPNTKLELIYETMEKLVEEGKILHIGCNNFNIDMLQKINYLQTQNNYSKFKIIETVYNLTLRGIEDKLIDYCKENKINIITYSPLGAGFLTGKYKILKKIPESSRFDIKPAHKDIYFKNELFNFLSQFEKFSKKVGISQIDLALKWAFSRKGISSVLIGAREIEHVKQAINALNKNYKIDIINKLDQLSSRNLGVIRP